MKLTFTFRNCCCRSFWLSVEGSKNNHQWLNGFLFYCKSPYYLRRKCHVRSLWCVTALCRGCPTFMPVTFRCTVASSPPTVWWIIGCWWRSQTLAATPFSAQTEVKKNTVTLCLLSNLCLPSSDILLSPSALLSSGPLRLVDCSGASEETGHLSERRRL